MKTKNGLTMLLVAGVIGFTACEENNDDTQKPTVSNLEVGHEDTVYTAGDFHFEFDVEDNEKLSYYTIEIHAEEDHSNTESISGEGHEHWEFDSTFTEIAGLKNLKVHHDLEMPANVEAGAYHFHMIVADEAGNTTSVERDLIFVEGEGYHDDDH